MLKQLHITNIILIESAQVEFGANLNVLSGETGSGKSAIMKGLSLITGERADTSMIRRGCEKGAVEAIFEVDKLPRLMHLLEESGIDHSIGAELIMRREISQSGKSRAFVNNQAVQIGLMKQIGEQLLSIVGQHANQWLLSPEKHREVVDIFGALTTHVRNFSESWNEEISLQKELETLKNSEAKRLRDIEVCRMELEELEEANLKEGEDEELFAAYTLLANAEERAKAASEISQTLSGERGAVLPSLNRQKSVFEQLTRIDSSLHDTAKAYENALLELQEVSYTLRNYISRVEYNPQRLHDVNQRLALITKLKKKYGATLPEIEAYMIAASEKLKELESADDKIKELDDKLRDIRKVNDDLCANLSQMRKEAAKRFEAAITSELRSLNMPKVEFQVQINPQKRNARGDDALEFYLLPNIGEHRVPIRDCASGGELSRIMLAIQKLLSGLEETPTVVFDEIDSNIGGETATIVGEKLRQIGSDHQVLCITHFPQVACQAACHFQISKIEENGRTFTRVRRLDPHKREQELTRMRGGK